MVNAWHQIQVLYHFPTIQPCRCLIPIAPNILCSSYWQRTRDKGNLHKADPTNPWTGLVYLATLAVEVQVQTRYRVPHSCQVGDRVWLQLQKERFKSTHHKIKPLWYGPDSLVKAVGDNAFQLDIPPDLGMKPVFNVSLLKPYFPPLFDE